MTPHSARNVRRAQVRQLAQDEPELSLRQLADRLGVSKDTVRRDLEGTSQDAPDEVAQDAPQVTEGGADLAQDDGAPCATDAQSAPPPSLPRRTTRQRGALDMTRCAACCRDLALLSQTGKTDEQIAHQAIAALAHNYRIAVARGEIEPDAPFIVRGMTLETAPRPRRVDDPAPDTE